MINGNITMVVVIFAYFVDEVKALCMLNDLGFFYTRNYLNQH